MFNQSGIYKIFHNINWSVFAFCLRVFSFGLYLEENIFLEEDTCVN